MGARAAGRAEVTADGQAYSDGVRRFLTWCEVEGVEAVLDRKTVAGFIAALLEAGAEPATARSRHLALRRFSAWLLDEGEIDDDRLLGSKPPKLDVKVVDPMSDEQLKPRRRPDRRPGMTASPRGLIPCRQSRWRVPTRRRTGRSGNFGCPSAVVATAQ